MHAKSSRKKASEERQRIREEKLQEILKSGRKRCISCKEVRTLEEFSSHKTNKTGVDSECKKCSAKRESKRRKTLPPRHNLATRLKRHYNLTLEQFDQMVENQSNQCAICGTRLTRGRKGDSLHVDHCHITGKVRELLCSNCNTGLGRFQDNYDIVMKAAAYLKKHRSPKGSG